MCEGHSGLVQAGMYANAAGHGDRSTLECLVRLGIPRREGALLAAVERGAPLAALRWLVAQGAPSGGAEEALQGLPPRRRGEVEAWLLGLAGPSRLTGAVRRVRGRRRGKARAEVVWAKGKGVGTLHGRTCVSRAGSYGTVSEQVEIQHAWCQCSAGGCQFNSVGQNPQPRVGVSVAGVLCYITSMNEIGSPPEDVDYAGSTVGYWWCWRQREPFLPPGVW